MLLSTIDISVFVVVVFIEFINLQVSSENVLATSIANKFILWVRNAGNTGIFVAASPERKIPVLLLLNAGKLIANKMHLEIFVKLDKPNDSHYPNV